MNLVAIGPAAGEEHQPAVDCEATPRPKRARPTQIVRIDRSDWKGAVGDRTRIVALHAGPEPVGLDTAHVIAALIPEYPHDAAPAPSRTLSAQGVAERVIGPESLVDIVMAQAVTPEYADIKAGPVIRWRHRSLGIAGGQIGTENRRHQAQYTERDGGEKNSLHCYPLSNCSDEMSGDPSRRDFSRIRNE